MNYHGLLQLEMYPLYLKVGKRLLNVLGIPRLELVAWANSILSVVDEYIQAIDLMSCAVPGRGWRLERRKWINRCG